MRKSKWIFFLFLMVTGSVGFSQSTTISPYSKYGIGVLRPQSFLQSFALGGTSLGLRSERDINVSNPASYSQIGITTFEVGVTNNALFLDDGNQQQNQNNPYIGHIAFAFPIINKKWGMSFGLLPYSNVGYNFISSINDPVAGNITAISSGEGGLNRVYFGNGFSFKLKRGIDPIGLILRPFEGKKMVKTDSSDVLLKIRNDAVDPSGALSIGLNGNYIFGATEIDDKVIYGDLANSLNSWSLLERSVSDFTVDFGVQYQKRFAHFNDKTQLDDIYILTLGATVGLASDLSAKQSELVRTFTGSVDFGTVKDTVIFTENVSDITQLPLEYGVGFSIAKRNKWLFGVDFETADWSSIESNSTVFTYNSSYSLRTGFELTPKYNDRNYFKRVVYRLGARYSTSCISVNNEDINEYGITFGVKLPVNRTGTSFPGISLGMEYGSRGKTGNGLIKETFYNFNVGLTINDKWFQKRKID